MKVLIIALFLPAAALCVEIHVPADYATIQEAIDNASHGDTITVSPGTYVENINFLGKTLILQSASGPEVTVIDGGEPVDPNYRCVVTFENNEGPDCVLRGFTLTNGSGNWFAPANSAGGGVFCHDCSPLIEGNIIRDNTARVGLGVFCYEASPWIIKNEILRNISDNQGAWGGGVCCKEASSPVIEGNTISENQITKYGGGGGIFAEADCHPTITYNVIDGNLASFGGGIHCKYTSAFIAFNLIQNNETDDTAQATGGGISLEGDPGSMVINNVIANNKSLRSGGGITTERGDGSHILNNWIKGNISKEGGGMSIQFSYSEPLVANNIFEGNGSTDHGGGLTVYCAEPDRIYNNTFVKNTGLGSSLSVGDGGFALVTNCIFYNNDPDLADIYLTDWYHIAPVQLKLQHCNLQGGQESVEVDPEARLIWGDGMIDADPLFADLASGDYHLTYPSPCKDVGLYLSGMPGEDFDGNPRTTWNMDIGADEFYTHLYHTGQVAPDEWIDIKLIGEPGHMAYLWGSLGALEPSLFTQYGFWHLDLPLLFTANLGTMNPDGLIVLTTQVPGTAVPPMYLYLQGMTNYRLTDLCTLALIE